jgi:hypothetical protein
MALLKIKKAKGAISIWRDVIGLIISNPVILLPFVVLAAFESLSLYILASSPHFPVNVVLAPPIRSIWGAVYLHYPYIYEILPRMFYYAKIAVGVVIGSLTSGAAVLLVYVIKKKLKFDLKSVSLSVLKRYISLFILSVIFFSFAHFLIRQPFTLLLHYFRTGHRELLFLGPKFWLNLALPAISFILTVVIQCLFVYSFPYVVIKEKKFLTALVSGIGLFLRLAVKTALVVIVPMILYIPISMLQSHFGVLVDQFGPESIGVVLFLSIIAGTVIVDALITIATTLIFIEGTDEK